MERRVLLKPSSRRKSTWQSKEQSAPKDGKSSNSGAIALKLVFSSSIKSPSSESSSLSTTENETVKTKENKNHKKSLTKPEVGKENRSKDKTRHDINFKARSKTFKSKSKTKKKQDLPVVLPLPTLSAKCFFCRKGAHSENSFLCSKCSLVWHNDCLPIPLTFKPISWNCPLHTVGPKLQTHSHVFKIHPTADYTRNPPTVNQTGGFLGLLKEIRMKPPSSVDHPAVVGIEIPENVLNVYNESLYYKKGANKNDIK